MDNKQEKAKETFANAWKKAADIGKKVADNTKKLVDQTKENIHEQQAKKYTVITKKEFKAKSFQCPSVIRIEDDKANRAFVEDADAIGWVELHKGVQVLHMYSTFAKKCGIVFIPDLTISGVYCQDKFDSQKYINATKVFEKARNEKMAELNHIACSLGAKRCFIEIVEVEAETNARQARVDTPAPVSAAVGDSSKRIDEQSGENSVRLKGHDDPIYPTLKWFAHDDNIKRLIENRLCKVIESSCLKLEGSSCVTMSASIACAIDDLQNTKGSFVMAKQAAKESRCKLIFEVEF